MSINRDKPLSEFLEICTAIYNGDELEYYVAGLDWQNMPITGNLLSSCMRIKVTADTIDWSHVAPEFKWMARDMDNRAWLYAQNPHRNDNLWFSCKNRRPDIEEIFASYKQGTCDWKDSLVSRAQCEAPDVALASDAPTKCAYCNKSIDVNQVVTISERDDKREYYHFDCGIKANVNANAVDHE